MVYSLTPVPDQADAPARLSLHASWQAMRAAALLRETRMCTCCAEAIRIATHAALRRTHHLEDEARAIERDARDALRGWHGAVWREAWRWRGE